MRGERGILLCLWLTCFLQSTAVLEPLTAFDWTVKWSWESKELPHPTTWRFHCEDSLLTFSASSSQAQFRYRDTQLGFGEWLPPLGEPPLLLKIRRDGFRWLAYFHRRLVAFTFADLPPTEKVTDDASSPLPAPCFMPPPLKRWQWRLPMDWQIQRLPDGSVAFAPPLLTPQPRLLFLSPPEGFLTTDFAVSMEVLPNAAKAIGIGVCFEQDGGYLWRWQRDGEEIKLQLLVVERDGTDWKTEVLHEEVLPLSPVHWHRLQVFRSGDQLWAGLDDEVLAYCQERRFGFGQVALWLEGGDRPLPLVRSITGEYWWCATLTPSEESGEPFPPLMGRWRPLVGNLETGKLGDGKLGEWGWMLQAESSSQRPASRVQKSVAIALLGEAPLPSWWGVDVRWTGEPIGLVWGWLNERHFSLLRLRPRPLALPSASPVIASQMELVAVRGEKEKVLDAQPLWLRREATYRLTVQLLSGRVVGFVNGIAFTRAETMPIGKVGVWAAGTLAVGKFWLVTGEMPLLPLTTEDAEVVQPFTETGLVAHEEVSFTLPAGLPPQVPLSARLSQEPITLSVERKGHQILLRLFRDEQFLGSVLTKLPSELPMTVKLERRDRFLLVWLGEKLAMTLRLP